MNNRILLAAKILVITITTALFYFLLFKFIFKVLDYLILDFVLIILGIASGWYLQKSERNKVVGLGILLGSVLALFTTSVILFQLIINWKG